MVALVLALAFALAAVAFAVTPTRPSPLSSDALAQRAPFNQIGHYPLDRRPDPALYRPHAEWLGRLILPTAAEQAAAPGLGPGEDWVWIELEQAPADQEALVGRRLPLGWRVDPLLDALVRAVTTDVHLDAAARGAIRDGNVVPVRLDGRRRVGPLQSLAGARPRDDVTVALGEVEPVAGPGGIGALRVGRPPVQITGRWQALVTILGPDAPGSDRYRVRHYSPNHHDFSGPLEKVRLPQQPPNRYGRWMSTPRGIEASTIGSAGWYLFGAPDAKGLFTAQALMPRALVQLRADRRIGGRDASLRHLVRDHWGPAPLRRGSFSRVALDPLERSPSQQAAAGPVPWRLGDRGLLLHTFGGIGGQQAEPTAAFTVTGHFAFGEVEVERDPFSGEPRFALRYHQIYANNPDGIVAGTQDWSAYAGDLRRGWLASRPVSDVLVRLDRFEDPQPSDPNLSLLRELQLQAEVLMARYRTGDGTGFNRVTAAISCVQDSSQALSIALGRLRQRLALAQGSGGERIGDLERLTAALHQVLNPWGVERGDWRRNAERVDHPGEGPGESTFQRGSGVTAVLLSWRSMLPRRAHDDLARVFLQQGAGLQLLRTNQTPGGDGRIAPLAPTTLFGQLPLVPTLLRRLSDALFTPLEGRSLLQSLGILLAYASVVLPLGRRSGFLPQVPRWPRPGSLLRVSLPLLLMPSLVEELLFRVLLLPHPLEGEGALGTLAWGLLSVGLFVAYHPLAGRSWYPPGRWVFDDHRFLVPCGLLGVACVAAYDLTGSLWAPVLIHWLVVTAWLEPLQGRQHLRAPR